jgi:hypothetical protein
MAELSDGLCAPCSPVDKLYNVGYTIRYARRQPVTQHAHDRVDVRAKVGEAVDRLLGM